MISSKGELKVRRLTDVSDAQIGELSDVLVDCVDGGASVSFMSPLSRAAAAVFWRGVADAVAMGHRALIVAEVDGIISGSVQLVLDTASPDAERLYIRMGWQRVGVVPGFALLPRGGLCDTTYFYRRLD